MSRLFRFYAVSGEKLPKRQGYDPAMGTHRWRVLAAGALLVTSCGSTAAKTTKNDVLSANAAASSNDPPLIVEPSTTAPKTVAPAGQLKTTVAETAASRVTVNDPLPPQPDGAADETGAEAAIRYAFQHWMLADLNKDLRAKLVERGEVNSDALDAGLKAARAATERLTIPIDAVRITGPTTAYVDFRMLVNNVPSPNFPTPITGTALLENGSWRVAGTVVCHLALGAIENCGAVQARNPTSPSTLVLSFVPDGIVGNPPGSRLEVGVPGGGGWSSAFGRKTLGVLAQTSVGLSGLSRDEAASVLASGRFGVTDGLPVEIAGRPGLRSESPDGVKLVVIRDDDVVVTVKGVGLTLDQLTQVAEGLVPD
jgi:hypothetical protein